MRRAKIVCTIGPATESAEKIQTLVDAGMNVARINRSHGDAASHEKVYHRVRQAAQTAGRAVAVLVDLQGPKIRLGTFAEGEVELVEDQTFTITTEDVTGTAEIVSTTYEGLPGDCVPGDRILIDDGNVAVRITDVDGPRVFTRVEVPGVVSDHKGINLPGVAVSVPALSDKDKDDLRWAIQLGADFIALSFVRAASDIDDVHAIMDEEGRRLPVIAKIEKPQAVDNLVEVVQAFDAVMVARGDLGVELPLEDVPIVQKRAVEIARRQAKPVIVATQVLESMISSPRPTRAEVSDCANAILDGADAVMLSGETSVGDYPIACVRTMSRIIESTEEQGGSRISPLGTTPHTKGGAITRAAVDIGEMIDIKYLAVFSQSGDSARRMARLRPDIPLIAFTPLTHTRNTLALTWGVQTYQVPQVSHTDDMVGQVDQVLGEAELAEHGDQLIIVAGTPPGKVGSTNSIRVHEVGELPAEG